MNDGRNPNETDQLTRLRGEGGGGWGCAETQKFVFIN